MTFSTAIQKAFRDSGDVAKEVDCCNQLYGQGLSDFSSLCCLLAAERLCEDLADI